MDVPATTAPQVLLSGRPSFPPSLSLSLDHVLLLNPVCAPYPSYPASVSQPFIHLFVNSTFRLSWAINFSADIASSSLSPKFGFKVLTLIRFKGKITVDHIILLKF